MLCLTTPTSSVLIIEPALSVTTCLFFYCNHLLRHPTLRLLTVFVAGIMCPRHQLWQFSGRLCRPLIILGAVPSSSSTTSSFSFAPLHFLWLLTRIILSLAQLQLWQSSVVPSCPPILAAVPLNTTLNLLSILWVTSSNLLLLLLLVVVLINGSEIKTNTGLTVLSTTVLCLLQAHILK